MPALAKATPRCDQKQVTWGHPASHLFYFLISAIILIIVTNLKQKANWMCFNYVFVIVIKDWI